MVNKISLYGRNCLVALAGLGLLMSAGCGNSQAPAQMPLESASAPPPVHQAADVVPPPTASSDPLAAPDPLAQGTEDKPIGPLSASGDEQDPLSVSDDSLASGPKMPTEHSHWLRGEIFDARVEVRLNGMYLGQYSAPIDKDITMKLRAGINTVSFAYHPLTPSGMAHLDLLESEHTPPIPPLASFRLTAGNQAAGPISQTFTFLAR